MRMRGDRGFTLIEVLTVVAVMGIIFAMAVPGLLVSLDRMKIAASARAVHSELQKARLKAVSANRPMRVRFDCPAAGQFRMVELIGTPAAPDARDSAVDRCSPSMYPYRAATANRLSRPNNDGPVQFLRDGATFTASRTIEFWPDGTAHAQAGTSNPWPPIATQVSIDLQYKTFTTSVTVNGVGKIQIQ